MKNTLTLAFEVERSSDNGKSSIRITNAPSIKLAPDGFVGKKIMYL